MKCFTHLIIVPYPVDENVFSTRQVTVTKQMAKNGGIVRLKLMGADVLIENILIERIL